MKKKFKYILIAIIFMFIGLLTLKELMSPLKVDVVKVKKDNLYEKISEDGYVKSINEYSIYPPYTAKIEKIHVKEGEYVKKDQILLELDTTEFEYKLKDYEGKLKSTQGQENIFYKKELDMSINKQTQLLENLNLALQKSEQDYERKKLLFKEGAISKEEFEKIENNYLKSKNDYEREEKNLSLLYSEKNYNGPSKKFYQGSKNSINAQIELTKHNIEQGRIKSPISGTISNFSLREGDYTDNSLIMTIFEDRDYTIETYLLTEDILYIKEGMKVDLILEKKDDDIIFSGVVESISPTAVEKTSTLGLLERRVKVTIKPEIPKDLKLKPGYEVDCVFKLNEQKNVISVPKISIFPYEEKKGLWVVRNNEAQLVKVDMGMETNNRVEIKNGINEGDLVIINPQIKGIKEGKKVKYNKIH